ncbi:MAG: hypothetical protein D6820_09665 [Lentisphaerae bacterium]|nr:MAG: hypothetical protein D6820_09665 [Lentisphaerota bacterium]
MFERVLNRLLLAGFIAWIAIQIITRPSGFVHVKNISREHPGGAVEFTIHQEGTTNLSLTFTPALLEPSQMTIYAVAPNGKVALLEKPLTTGTGNFQLENRHLHRGKYEIAITPLPEMETTLVLRVSYPIGRLFIAEIVLCCMMLTGLVIDYLRGKGVHGKRILELVRKFTAPVKW